MRISHSIALSALLLGGVGYAKNITVKENETKNETLTDATNDVSLEKNGVITLISNTTNTTTMTMYRLTSGATATFNTTTGSLNLNLAMSNTSQVQNNITFNVAAGSTLTLTAGNNGMGKGVFQGANTALQATINGNFDGTLSNNGNTSIKIENGTLSGNIIQSAANTQPGVTNQQASKLRVEINSATLNGNITSSANVEETSLWANENSRPTTQVSTINGNITQEQGNLIGVVRGVRLTGTLTQTGQKQGNGFLGRADIAFHTSVFEQNITLSNINSTIHFYDSKIKSISTNDGFNTINLKGREGTTQNGTSMESYSGTNGTTFLKLEHGSSMKNASQNGGELTLRANSSSVNGSISGSNNAPLNINLSNSQVTGNITNTANDMITNTEISTSATTTIGGNISLTGGTLSAILEGTTINGGVTHSGAVTINGNQTSYAGRLSILRATDSTIQQGISFSNISVVNSATPHLSLINSTVNQGIRLDQLREDPILHARSNLKISASRSTINGGYIQNNEPVNPRTSTVDFVLDDSSTLNGGIQVRDGKGIEGDISTSTSYASAFNFKNNSTLNGGVTSNDHSVWINFDNSNGNGGFTNTNGDIYIKATNNSNLNGNLISQTTGETRLYLDNSTFTGNIQQTGGNQTLDLQNTSKIIGNITNNDTIVDFTLRSNSELQGSYTQTNGTLDWSLGGSAIVHQDITLNNVVTTLGNGQAIDKLETFKGNFTQNDGSLTGNLEGLTLEGQFTQNRGVTDITFSKANFEQKTTITDATLTNIIFDNGSNLKDTTISNSTNIDNAFKLDNVTILDGNFTLSHSKVTLSVLNGSKITGNIISNDPDNDLKLEFGKNGNGNGNEIGGNIEVKNGNLNGSITGTTVGGSLTLEDAETHLHIVDSAVNQGISITRGQTYMTIDNSTIGTGFTMTGANNTGTAPALSLSINNGTTINGDLKFDDTTVSLGGLGDGNTITGSLVTTNTTLTTGGDDFNEPNHNPAFLSVSGLTIEQQLKQINGSMDLTLSNKSAIKGLTSFDNTQQSHLELLDSTMSVLEVSGGNNNEVTLDQGSAQDGGITLTGAITTIKALGQSTITGDITSTATAPATSDTTLILSESTLTGNINQNNGNLTLDFSQNASMVGITTLDNLDQYQATLSQSSITGNFNITKSNIKIDMSNGSLIDGDLNLIRNPSFTLNASASTLQGNIVHTGEVGQGQEIKLNFTNGSTLNNEGMTITGDLLIQSSDSQINSRNGITLALGSLELSLSNSTGTIESIATGGSNTISILTTNSSNSTINKIIMSDESKLTLTGQNEAILNGDIELENKATATIVSLGNANLKVNITPSTTSTLGVTLNGGILEGTITQTPLASVGTMTLGTAGNFGGRWIATGDSSIKTLNITNSSGNVANEILMLAPTHTSNISMIDTTFDPGGVSRIGMNMLKAGGNPPQAGETLEHTVSMGSLSGLNGVFRVYTDIGAEASDKISTATATGNHIMQVYYNPATFTQDVGDRYIVVAHVDDQQTTASFEGGITLVGTQVYTTSLTKVTAQNGQGFDWILGKTQNAGANYGTKVISSILQSQYRSFALQTESLRQRMGELRDTNRVHGLWGRYTMGTTYTPESDVAVEIEDNFYSAWIGYDQNVLDLKGQDFFGFALSYSLLNPQGEDYTGNVHSIGFNFYNTFIARNDFYVDLVIKYILSMANYEISYYSLAKNTPEYINHKLMINAEIGKKFKLSESKNYFFLQPEAQITAGYIFGDEVDFVDFTQTTIKSSTSGIAPVILRTGLSAGYSLNQGIKSDFYIGTSFFYETTNGGDVHLDDGNNTVNYSHKGTFKMSFQGGFDLLFTDNARVYFEAGTSFLGKTNMTYSINAGARFSFGYKNTRKLIVPSSITPPPPPQEPYDPRNIPVITDYTQEDIRNNNSLKPRANGGGDDYFINTRKAYRDKSTVEKTIRSR